MNTAKEILRKLRDEIPYFLPTKADPYIIEAIELHTDLATKELQEENQHLLEWKRQMLEVWNPVLDWGQNHPDIKLGESISKFVLKTLQENQQLKERADLLFRKFKYIKSCIEQELPPEDMIAFINEALTAYQTNKTTTNGLDDTAPSR